jgi:uncharacterized protein YjbI with pentapeptide repeats
LNGTQFAARVGLLILDVPARWSIHFFNSVIGTRGYLVVGSVLAVYVALIGLIDARSTQEETHASVERSVFMTLVSSGNAASFIAAMKDFGPTQLMTAHKVKFFWLKTYQPNREPMLHWAKSRLGLCQKKSNETKDCSFPGDDTRLDLSAANLRRADLRDVDLHDADLHGAHLSGAHLSGAHLSGANLNDADLNGANLSGAHLFGARVIGANLSDADLRGASLRGAHLHRVHLRGADLSAAKLRGADLSGADLSAANLRDAYLSDENLSDGANLSDANLCGTNLSGANRLRGANLRGAKYCTDTKFPPSFDPKPAGMVPAK